MVPPGQGGQGTSKANNRFDHFLISSDLEQEEAVESKIIVYADNQLNWKVSDHRPVAAWFKTDWGFKDRAE